MSAALTHRLATLDDVPVLKPLMEAAIGELLKPFLPPEQVAASFAVMGLDTQLIADGTYFVIEYEGQIAGLGDAPPGQPVRARLIRGIQDRSADELRRRRTEAVRLIQALTSLEFVNGGGTGSLETTASDESVTELTAGSGPGCSIQWSE